MCDARTPTRPDRGSCAFSGSAGPQGVITTLPLGVLACVGNRIQGRPMCDTTSALGVASRGPNGRSISDTNDMNTAVAHINGLGATTVPTDDAGEEFYDPDPYKGVDWHPDHMFQLDVAGKVERQAALRLERLGRMRDCARITDTDWSPTTGGFPTDAHPARRIDRWYATYHLPDAAVVGYRVADAALVGLCSDHLPVVIDADEDALAAC